MRPASNSPDMKLRERFRALRTCPTCEQPYAAGTRFCLPCEDPLADRYEQIVWQMRDIPEVAFILDDAPAPVVATNPFWLDVSPHAVEDVRSILADARALMREPDSVYAASA